MSTFRRYINCDSPGNIVQVNLQDIDPNVKEYHIVLAFATDYDDKGNHCNGVFTFNVDLHGFIQALARFEKENPDVNIKLFISIGSRDPRFPFRANESWVYWATDSLKQIFGNLGDWERIQIGIDVFYEYIDAEVNHFATYVGQLITTLRNDNIITLASITTSLNTKEMYTALFNNCGDLIDWVVYQYFHDQIMTREVFIERSNALAATFPNEKLLAGYSTNKDDWGIIKPFIFFMVVIYLLQIGVFAGVSIWDYDDLVANGWELSPFRAVLAHDAPDPN